MVLVIFCFIFLPSSLHAELKAMDENALKSSTGQAGLTNFTMSNSTARLFLDIHMETYATIDSLRSGAAANYDIQWNNVILGDTSTDTPLTIDGLVFIADFDDTSATNPVLERIVIGSNRLQGTISANMLSYSGTYNPAIALSGGSPTVYDKANLGQTTFNFNSDGSPTSNMGLFFILDLGQSGSTPGLKVVAGYDETEIKSGSIGTWWDSP